MFLGFFFLVDLGVQISVCLGYLDLEVEGDQDIAPVKKVNLMNVLLWAQRTGVVFM